MNSKAILVIFLITMATAMTLNSKVILACTGCAAGFTGSGAGNAGGGQCSNDAWVDKLVGQESGDSYTIEMDVDASGNDSSSAVGRYQFIDGTRKMIGEKYNLPCSSGTERTAESGGNADYHGFQSCPALQDAYFAGLTNDNVEALRPTCNNHCGPNADGDIVTLSGMAAIAHNVGPNCARAWATGGRAAMNAITNPPNCRDSSRTDPIAKYGIPMGNYDMGGGEGGEGSCNMQPGPGNPVPFQGHLIGCNPEIYEKTKTKVAALRQQETEAAKALITKPVSVQQLTCFDQYAKANAEEVGAIRSNPGAGISASINPIVKDVNLLNLAANFMGGNIPGLGEVQNVLNGGLQSIMNDALGGLTGGLLSTAGGAEGCKAMDEMFNLLQCVDFPEMPSLPDILGDGGQLGGILQGLNDASTVAGALGTLASGNGGGGVLGAVCQAVKGKFGGGGSGGTRAFVDLLEQNQRSPNNCNYNILLALVTNMNADLNGNNIIEVSELESIDSTYGNNDCVVQASEITQAIGATQ